jgi:hypothetical protein
MAGKQVILTFGGRILEYDNQYVKYTGNSNNFVATGQTSRAWREGGADSSGNIYWAVLAGDLYERTGGVGAFTGLGQTAREWQSIMMSHVGNLWACAALSDVYENVGGTFQPEWTLAYGWQGMCEANNILIACENTSNGYELGYIWQWAYSGSKTQISGAKNWSCVFSDPSGNVYGVENTLGGVYKQTAGVGSFNLIYTIAGAIAGCSGNLGNIYICTQNGTFGSPGYIYMDNVLIPGCPNLAWVGMVRAPNGNIYAAVTGGDIYESI